MTFPVQFTSEMFSEFVWIMLLYVDFMKRDKRISVGTMTKWCLCVNFLERLWNVFSGNIKTGDIFEFITSTVIQSRFIILVSTSLPTNVYIANYFTLFFFLSGGRKRQIQNKTVCRCEVYYINTLEVCWTLCMEQHQQIMISCSRLLCKRSVGLKSKCTILDKWAQALLRFWVLLLRMCFMKKRKKKSVSIHLPWSRQAPFQLSPSYLISGAGFQTGFLCFDAFVVQYLLISSIHFHFQLWYGLNVTVFLDAVFCSPEFSMKVLDVMEFLQCNFI